MYVLPATLLLLNAPTTNLLGPEGVGSEPPEHMYMLLLLLIALMPLLFYLLVILSLQ